jgi:hypothetical protein
MKTTIENVRPEVLIPEGVALSEDSEGFVRSLVLGERFAGFAMNTRMPNEAASVNVWRDGSMEMFVDRLMDAAVGTSVYATSPRNFSVAEPRGAVEIGTIVKIVDSTHALVKFTV